MQTFKDANGLEWKIEFNLAEARRIRGESQGVETLREVDFLDYTALLASLADVFFAADLLFVVCKEQATARAVDEAEFGRALRGRSISDAINALTAEYLDFFPDPTVAAKLRAVVEETKRAQEAAVDLIVEETRKTIREALATAGANVGGISSTASHFAAGTSPESSV